MSLTIRAVSNSIDKHLANEKDVKKKIIFRSYKIMS